MKNKHNKNKRRFSFEDDADRAYDLLEQKNKEKSRKNFIKQSKNLKKIRNSIEDNDFYYD
jgi:hypothetical protein